MDTPYAAGITGVARPRYAWTTIVGIAPFWIVVTFLGSRLQTVSLSDWRLWALVAGLPALLYAGTGLRTGSRPRPEATGAIRRAAVSARRVPCCACGSAASA